MVLPQFPEMPLCGRTTECRVYREGAWPDCAKKTGEQFHPSFMAEEVCSNALARHMHLRRNQVNLHTAWNALEFGLGMQERPSDAGAFFDYAEDLFEKIYETSSSPIQKNGAQLGMLYMPAYRARLKHETLPARMLSSLHADVCDMLNSFDERYDPKGTDRFAGVKPELITLALFGRMRRFEWLAFPASPREESAKLSQFNHDCYVIRDGIKVPIQVKRKTGSGYDQTVAIVSLHRIVGLVNAERERRFTQEWGRKRKTTRPLVPLEYDDFADLLVREASNQWLTEHEQWLLELGTMAAVMEVIKKHRIIRAERAARDIGTFGLAA